MWWRMADPYDTRRCTAETVEAIGAAMGQLGQARGLFSRDEECDSGCDHDAPPDLLDDLDAADKALVSALATCTAALHGMLQES
jgi:hypothetical protein